MIINFVSKLLNLNTAILFNLLLFANALSCCYLVIWMRTTFSEMEIIIYLVYYILFLMMFVIQKVRTFHTICRTRQFYSVCRTTCVFGISLTTLSQSTFHTLLFRVSLSTDLQFSICLWLITSFRFSQKNGLTKWTLLPYAVPVPISPSITSFYLVRNTNYIAALCTTYFVHFPLCRICQNYCPANFSSILSV